jgi:DNA-binding MarR family transcriptional regulator
LRTEGLALVVSPARCASGYPLPWLVCAIALLAIVVGAPLGAAAETGMTLSLGSATPVASPAGGVVDASGVTLSDGRTLLAYWHPGASGLVLSASVVEASGAVAAAPVDLNISSSGVYPTALATDGAGHAAVLWVEGTQAIVSYFDGASFSAPGPLSFPGYDVWNCLLDGGNASFVAACQTSNPLIAGDPLQVRVGWFISGSYALSKPLTLLPLAGQSQFAAAISLDHSGDAWVAFAVPTPASLGRNDLYVTALDATGGVAFGPSILISGTNKTIGASIAPSPMQVASAYVAYAEIDASPADVEVQVREFSTLPSPAPTPAFFSSSQALVSHLALSDKTGVETSVLLLEWAEDRATDRDAASGTAHPRPVLAALDENLSILLPPAAQEPVAGQSAVFVVGGGDLLEFGPSLLLHRVTVAASPPGSRSSEPPPANSPFVVAVVIALAGGSASLALASISDRFKWALLAGVWPLYVALRRDKALLDNMRRGAILQVVSESPGVRFTDVSRRTGISSGALRYHLAVLEEFGFVSRATNRNAVRLYPAGKNPIHEEPFRAIRDQIIGEIRKAPGLSHTELAGKVGVKWSTLLYHAEILEETGAIQTKFEGRTRRYWAAENR